MKKMFCVLLILVMFTLILPGSSSEETCLDAQTPDEVLDAIQLPETAMNIVTQTWTDDTGATCIMIYYEEVITSDCSGASPEATPAPSLTAEELAAIMNWVEAQLTTEAGLGEGGQDNPCQTAQPVNPVENDPAVFQTARPAEPVEIDPAVCQTARPDETVIYDPAVFQTAQPVETVMNDPAVCQTARPTDRPTEVPVFNQQPTAQWTYPTPTARPTAQPTTRPTAQSTQTPTISTGDYTTIDSTMQEQKLLNLLNEDRARNGLPPLTLDPELSELARLKSNDMNSNHYFAHESPTYGNAAQMLDTFNYEFKGVGENIAHHRDVEKAEAAFMSSDGHRRNILGSQWEKVGIGIAYDENGHMYVTQLFAR